MCPLRDCYQRCLLRCRGSTYRELLDDRCNEVTECAKLCLLLLELLPEAHELRMVVSLVASRRGA